MSADWREGQVARVAGGRPTCCRRIRCNAPTSTKVRSASSVQLFENFWGNWAMMPALSKSAIERISTWTLS